MYTQDSNKRQKAQWYADLGFHLFPCHTLQAGVCTCGDSTCKNIAKHPLTAHGVKDASNDPSRLDHYFSGDYEAANVALATGETSGVSVIDVDDPNALAALTAQYGPLPPTWTALTGSGGFHYFFRHDDRWRDVLNSVKFAGSLDVRTTGGYVLLPPSIHRTGNIYSWIVAPDDCELATAPDWLMALLPRRKSGDSIGSSAACPRLESDSKAAHDAIPTTSPAKVTDTFTLQRAATLADRAALYLESTPPAVSGQRGHDHTFSVVCRVCELFGALTDDELLSVISAWNSRCSPPWSESELRHKLASARSKVVPQGTPTPHTQTANDDWPTLDDAALYGLSGEVIRTLELHTEADSVALLLTLLTAFGCCVGRSPHYIVEGGKHHANLFTAIVGSSSRARKGTSLGRIVDVMSEADDRRVSGLSSGEGLIYALRDAETDQVDGKFVTSGGIADKRLWVVESEFARTLKALKREGNTLSAILRDAFDRGDIASLTKGNTLRATDAHIAITTHITREELGKTLDAAEAFNGFANRFLWALVRRSKLLPDGGGTLNVDDLRQRLSAAIAKARTIGLMERSARCARRWREVYADLVAEKSGLWDAVTSRGEAHTLRLSMLYALLDCSPIIDTQHLEAALAVWRYCDDSARIIFGGVVDDSSGSKLDRRFLETVKRMPGVSKTDLRNSVSKATPTDRIDAAIERLLASGDIVRMLVVGHAGRTVESFYHGVSLALDVGNWGFRDSQSETTTGNETPTTVNPQIPKSLSPSNVEPATLGELLDWRNLNSGTFTRRADGVVWVTTANGSMLPPAMEAAILANQATLTAFVPANAHTPTLNVSDDEPLTADAQTLYDELVRVDDAPLSVTVAVDVDAFVAELNALQA